MKEPLISIVMPTYNQCEFIKEAIVSVLDQTYSNIELIIVDNYSEDNTENIVKSFTDGRIKYIKFSNKGIIAASRNQGIKKAQGEFIAFIDSDDTWFSDKIQVQYEFLKDNPEIGLLGCQLEVDSSKKRYKGQLIPEGIESRQGDLYIVLLKNNFIMSSSAIVRASIFEEIGYLDESFDLVSVEDWDLWLRIARHYPIAFLDKRVGRYRMHDANMSSDIKQVFKCIKVIDKHITKGWSSLEDARKAKAMFYLRYGWVSAGENTRMSRELFNEAIKNNNKIYCIGSMAKIMTFFPFLCRSIRHHSLDKVFVNSYLNNIWK